MTMAYDLTLLLERVDGDRRYQPLAKQIRVLWANYATRSDLDAASDALAALRDVAAPNSSKPEEVHAHGMAASMALQNNAIVLYCRAVHSRAVSGKYRVDIREGMDHEQKHAHRQITELRDKVIAHHGYGAESIGGPWLRDRVTIEFENDKAKVRYPFVALRTRSDVCKALQGLVNHGITLFAEKSQAMEAAVANSVHHLRQTDQHFAAVLEQCLFDSAAFFEEEGFAAPLALGERRHIAWRSPEDEGHC